MSVPLRKEQPEFEDDLTTADLAQGKRPAGANRSTADRSSDNRSNEDRPGPVLTGRTSGEFPQDVENAPENVRTDLRKDFRGDTSNDVDYSNMGNEDQNAIGSQNVRSQSRNEQSETRNASSTSSSDAAPLFPNNELEE